MNLIKVLVCGFVSFVFLASQAEAKIFGRKNHSVQSNSHVQSSAPVSVNHGGLAQHKSNVQASSGHMRHIGGSFGAGRYEGVGFSTVSADDAIRRCCYWGQKTPVDIGVQRGPNGWYATVLYR